MPGKIRMFLWRLSKHSLPTEDVRTHRHMSNSVACGLCGAPDPWRHSLLECTTSRCTWALVEEEIGHLLVRNSEPKAKQWLFTQMEALSHAHFVKLAVTFVGYLVGKDEVHPRGDFPKTPINFLIHHQIHWRAREH